MIACSACAKKNPDSATRCLECGAPLSPSFDLLKADSSRSVWIGIAVVLVAGGLLAAYLVPKLSMPGAVHGGKSEAGQKKPPTVALTTLKTRGRSDFSGINISVDCPLSWKVVPIQGPYSGLTFQRPDSGLRDYMIIMVLPEFPEPVTEKTFRAVVLEAGGPNPFLPTPTKYTRKAFVEGLAFPCALLEFDAPIPESPDLIGRNRNYILAIDGKMVHIVFARIGPHSKDLLGEWSEMMTQVVRSIRPD